LCGEGVVVYTTFESRHQLFGRTPKSLINKAFLLYLHHPIPSIYAQIPIHNSMLHASGQERVGSWLVYTVSDC